MHELPERSPQALADESDTKLLALAHDLEVCRTMRVAREQLRVLAWNRYAACHAHRDMAFRLRRRRQGHGHMTFWQDRTAHACNASPNRVHDHA